ncbi:MAG: site-specific integrase [Clostridiales bacterium]
MAGSYRKLKNGKWELCVSLGFDSLTGKRIRKFKTIEATGKRAVEKILADFVLENQSSKDYNVNITVKEFSELWINDYVKKNLKKKTISDYMDILERVNTCLGKIMLKNLKPTHLIRFYTMLGEDGARKDGKPGGLSNKTIKHHHLVLSSMLNTAYQWELIKENICNRVDAPKLDNKNVTALTIIQTKSLINALHDEPLKYKLIVMIALFTGLRRGEIMGLEWNSIDFNESTITVFYTSSYTADFGIYEDTPKTFTSKRTNFVPEEIIKMLNDYRVECEILKEKAGKKWVESDRIFTQKNGNPMSPETISKWFPKFIRRKKLPYTKFHGLRHIHGSILLALGLDPASVSEQLGHANLQMLFQVYGHNIRKNSSEVADIMKSALLDDLNKT